MQKTTMKKRWRSKRSPKGSCVAASPRGKIGMADGMAKIIVACDGDGWFRSQCWGEMTKKAQGVVWEGGW